MGERGKARKKGWLRNTQTYQGKTGFELVCLGWRIPLGFQQHVTSVALDCLPWGLWMV
jgi:hypothetical protein